jgi:hypothetical protein
MNPPTEWLQFGDEPPVKKELIIQVCFIMGDQKRQDNLVGCRLNNTGWRGRSQRGCMRSGISSLDPCLQCQPVPIEAVHELQNVSLSSEPGLPAMEAILAKCPLLANGNQTKGAKEDAKAAEDFVKRRAGLAHKILGEVFTMRPFGMPGALSALVPTKMECSVPPSTTQCTSMSLACWTWSQWHSTVASPQRS